MTHEPLNDEELIIAREGQAAAFLLASEDLQLIIKALMVESFAIFTESLPAHQTARDDSYNLIRGLKAIEAELLARVQRREAIERRMDAQAADASDPLIDDATFGVQE